MLLDFNFNIPIFHLNFSIALFEKCAYLREFIFLIYPDINQFFFKWKLLVIETFLPLDNTGL